MKIALLISVVMMAQAGTAHAHRYSAAQNYLAAKFTNPNISDQAKKTILNQALRNAKPEIAKLNGYERQLAESSWNAVRAMGDHSQWQLITQTIKQLNLAL